MDFRKFARSEKAHFKVFDHYIEHGSVSIQTSNIVTTEVSKIKLVFDDPEPEFSEVQPEENYRLGLILILSITAWLVLFYVLQQNIWISLSPSFVIVFIFIKIAHIQYKPRYEEWKIKYDDYKKKHSRWVDLKTNPPFIHKITLITNAEISPFIVNSFNEDQIMKLNEEIKMSMSKKSGYITIEIQIDEINLNGFGSINNFGSFIYEQSLHEA